MSGKDKGSLLEHDLERQRRQRQYELLPVTAKKISKTRGDTFGQLEALVTAEIATEKLLAELVRERPVHYLQDVLGSVAERPKISPAQVGEVKPLITAAGKVSRHFFYFRIFSSALISFVCLNNQHCCYCCCCYYYYYYYYCCCCCCCCYYYYYNYYSDYYSYSYYCYSLSLSILPFPPPPLQISLEIFFLEFFCVNLASTQRPLRC